MKFHIYEQEYDSFLRTSWKFSKEIKDFDYLCPICMKFEKDIDPRDQLFSALNYFSKEKTIRMSFQKFKHYLSSFDDSCSHIKYAKAQLASYIIMKL